MSWKKKILTIVTDWAVVIDNLAAAHFNLGNLNTSASSGCSFFLTLTECNKWVLWLMFPIFYQLQIERGRGVGRVQAITFYRLSYRLQLHGACWLLPCRAFQKGSVSRISSEQEGNTEGRTVLCQSLRKNYAAHAWLSQWQCCKFSTEGKILFFTLPLHRLCSLMWQTGNVSKHDKHVIDDAVQIWRSPAMPSGIAMPPPWQWPLKPLESCAAGSWLALKQNELSSPSGSEDNLENVKRV